MKTKTKRENSLRPRQQTQLQP